MTSGGNYHNNHCKICVVDDDLSILRATQRLLTTEGWKVEVFSDPTSFLESAQSNSCSVAVLDILMPIMNGLEVQSRLRDVSPSTRVIILTSVDDPAVQSRALEAGAVAVLCKPIKDHELLNQIQAAADELAADPQTAFRPREKMVRDTGFEPVTPTVSR